jgi:uncharacterized protein
MKSRVGLVVTTTTVPAGEPTPVPAPKPMLDAEALEAFLLACRPSVSVLSLDGLDGYLTALLIGPKFVDPRIWMASLFGEAALLAAADTREHLAIHAVADRYNRLSITLSEHPDRYRPMFRPHREGGADALYWWLGFTAGIELVPRSWKKITDSRQPGRHLFEPIYSVASRNGPTSDSAVGDVTKAVLAIRQHFLPQRIRSMR